MSLSRELEYLCWEANGFDRATLTELIRQRKAREALEDRPNDLAVYRAAHQPQPVTGDELSAMCHQVDDVGPLDEGCWQRIIDAGTGRGRPA